MSVTLNETTSAPRTRPSVPQSELDNAASLRGGRRILVVDDDPAVRRAILRVLSSSGFDVTSAADGAAAIEHVANQEFDAIVSDIDMPRLNGIEFLGAVREYDLDVPVVLVTGVPELESAIAAIELGAYHYLQKPFDFEKLLITVTRAARLHEMARLKRKALEISGLNAKLAADRAGLNLNLNRALARIWMAYQPIVRATDGSVFGYEALMRSDEQSLPHPGAILEAAERLDRLQDVGRAVRAATPAPIVPLIGQPNGLLFVNVHPRDLIDPQLSDPEAPMSKIAEHVILEITERASLDKVGNVKKRVAELRELGFRIAIDDLGSGYAGLTSFATLQPEFVKIDMTMVRDIDQSKLKRTLVRSMTDLCKQMNMIVVAEGVETVAERDALLELDVDLLQGYLMAKPGRPFPDVTWPAVDS